VPQKEHSAGFFDDTRRKSNDARRISPRHKMTIEDPLVTRRTGIAYCRDEEGIPLTKSVLDKKCMTHEGPPVAGFWGKRELYRRSEFVAWAKTLITDKPQVLGV
jgi:hypothetical protein